jgi:histidinol phosphatase-like PHP family hydrolase
MRKLEKTEKFIIAMSDDNYTAYDCTEHGIFLNKKDDDNGKCPHPMCDGQVSIIKDINKLKEKFKVELGY